MILYRVRQEKTLYQDKPVLIKCFMLFNSIYSTAYSTAYNLLKFSGCVGTVILHPI